MGRMVVNLSDLSSKSCKLKKAPAGVTTEAKGLGRLDLLLTNF